MRTRTSLSVSVFFAGVVMAACSTGREQTGATAAAITGPATPLARYATPAWASSDRFLGRVGADTSVKVQVHLAIHNAEAATAMLADISDPTSANYGKYLTTEEWNTKFAPSAEDVTTVSAHLQAHGLTITHVPSNNAFVVASGKASAVESAFSTQLGRYSHETGERRAALMTPSLPQSVATRVLTVIGIDTPGRAKPALATARAASAGTAAAPTCSNYFGQYKDTGIDPDTGAPDPRFGPEYPNALPLDLCTGYVPGQLRALYGFDQAVAAGIDGTGQTVAIIDAWMSPTLISDAQTYFAAHDPRHPLLSSQITARWTPGPATVDPCWDDWSVEQSLDVQTVHSMAPGANIAYTAAESDSDDDLMAAMNYIISDNLATIVTNSWGGNEQVSTENAAWEAIVVQAGLKGIGYYFATGDYGDNVMWGGSSVPVAGYPASLPEATAVGGTAVALDRNGNQVFNLGWENAISEVIPSSLDAGAWPPAQGGGTPTCLTDDAGAAVATPGMGIANGVTTPSFSSSAHGQAGPRAAAWTWWPADPGGYTDGANGGVSILYTQPAYQKGIVPSHLAGRTNPMRTTPDVAMLADPYTGFLVGFTDGAPYQEFPIGGTSLATPMFAATMALAQQLHGHSYGSANAALYHASNRGAFTDVVPSDQRYAVVFPGIADEQSAFLATFDYHGPGNSNATAVGYDTVTGLGTPAGFTFLSSLR